MILYISLNYKKKLNSLSRKCTFSISKTYGYMELLVLIYAFRKIKDILQFRIQ